MKTKHTPGPWRVSHTGVILGPSIGCSSPIVAQMPVWFANPAPGHASQSIQDANARLIASSPALLAALETVLAWSEHPDGNLLPPHPPLAAMVREKDSVVRAAIAAATGEDKL